MTDQPTLPGLAVEAVAAPTRRQVEGRPKGWPDRCRDCGTVGPRCPVSGESDCLPPNLIAWVRALRERRVDDPGGPDEMPQIAS